MKREASFISSDSLDELLKSNVIVPAVVDNLFGNGS
jgi:hypothetical protein